MLERYKLIDPPIDGGGYSDVYRALDTFLNRIVAVKILRNCTPDNLRRFRRERDMLQVYRNNPYVIDLLDSNLECATPFLVLEFSELGSLHKYVANRVNWKHVAKWMRDVVRALRPIHARGDWHRDIKPGNLLLFKDANGRLFVKISDFGFAQRIDNPSGPMTHSPHGTKGYIDPVAEINGYNAASDIFSLARTINELLTGDGEGGAYPTDIPIELQLLLNSMTRMTRDRRPTADEILSRIAAILEPKVTVVPQPVQAPISIPWGTILVGGLVGLAGLVVASANTWDDNVGQYRNSKGQFASGLFG
jgi:serine/threonine protein kinase